MANTIELKQQIAQGEYDAAFTKLYGAAAVQEQRKRYTDLINEFAIIPLTFPVEQLFL